MKVHERIAELRKRYRILLWPLVLLLVITLYPFKTTIVPEWGLRVVDDSYAAVPAIKVTEHWQHYLFDAEAQEDVRTTREDGRVSFPARTMRASLLHRAFATVVKVSRYGERARLNAYASVVVWGSRNHETTVAIYKSPDPPQTEVLVHRLP